MILAQVACGAAQHWQGQVLQTVWLAARVTDHAPPSHVAERAGCHVVVLALPGQDLHCGAQGGLLRKLGIGGGGHQGQEPGGACHRRDCGWTRWDLGEGSGLRGQRSGRAMQQEGLQLYLAHLQQEQVMVDGVALAARMWHCAEYVI